MNNFNNNNNNEIRNESDGNMMIRDNLEATEVGRPFNKSFNDSLTKRQEEELLKLGLL